MVLNSDNHLESSGSRDEVNIVEAEGNVVPMEDLNDETTEQQNVEPQQQNEQVDAPINTAELAETVTTSSNNFESENQSTDEDFEDEPDESLGERLMALSEIFPEPVRDMASKAGAVTKTGVRKVFKTTCRLSWVLATSALVLLAPIAFENERSQLQELQKMHEKKMLFGPNTVVAPRLGERIVSH